MSDYPHECPVCKSPAYLGLYAHNVRCSNARCEYFEIEIARSLPDVLHDKLTGTFSVFTLTRDAIDAVFRQRWLRDFARSHRNKIFSGTTIRGQWIDQKGDDSEFNVALLNLPDNYPSPKPFERSRLAIKELEKALVGTKCSIKEYASKYVSDGGSQKYVIRTETT